MNNIIKKDLYRYIGVDCERFFSQLRYLLLTPPFTFIFFYRKAQLSHNLLTKFLYEFCVKLLSIVFGIQIPSKTNIGEGFRIAHFGTIIINPKSIIGSNFTISPGCLVGNSEGKKNGSPHIGNRVYMSANSMIIGGVNVGDDVMLAPGALVNFDVPDNSIVLGNPGKIIQRDSSPTEKYINFMVQ